MAVDPKYADLPWIAHGQPDVYYSNELPEADQTKYKDPMEMVPLHQEIESGHLNTEDAMKKFSSHVVDSTHVDAIDKAKKVGYNVDRNLYELLDPSSKKEETLMQKFQRLQAEVRELAEDSSKLEEQLKADPDQPVKAGELVELTEALKAQLNSFELEKTLGSNADVDVNAPESLLVNQLKTKCSSYKTKAPTDKSKSDSFACEVYQHLDKDKELEKERIANIDRRIQRIESLIGNPDPSKLSALTADTVHHTLFDVATKLSAKSNLFKVENLDSIESRLVSLLSKLNSITEKPSVIADADNEAKISELYELVKKWQSVSDSLPVIVERMESLQELHQQAADFSSALVSLEKDQKQVDESLKTYKSVLDQVQANFQESMRVVSENITTTEAKMRGENK